jgi:hypothetical protein
MDELKGYVPQESDHTKHTAEIIAVIILCALLFLVILFAVTSGCVTASKETYHQIVDTPTPTPTPEPTPEPEVTEAPVVMVTEDPSVYMLRTNGYYLREWHQWFRASVQGINSQGTKDLHTLVTVYDYKFMDAYHWWSVSWYRNFVNKPEDRNDQYLFFFVNMYSDDAGDGRGDDVRQYAMGCNDFSAQVEDRIYYPEWIEYPERRITEFDNMYNFAHVETPGPYGYLIVQEKGSGIITAEQKEWLMGGRSNAHDGWCLVEVPRKDSQGNPVNATNTKILGNFGNLGGTAWWKLETQPLLSNSVT